MAPNWPRGEMFQMWQRLRGFRDRIVRLWKWIFDAQPDVIPGTCKHVDFLLCDRASQRPLLAIELDDSSHTKFDHAESDKFKSDLFTAVELKLMRVKVRQTYPKGEIGNQVRSKMAL